MPHGIGNPPLPPVHYADESRIEFKSQTVLVQVPVVVTDKSGAHIHGLGRDDFQVFENSKQQKLAAYEEVQATHLALAAPAPQKGEFSNLAVSGDAPRTITVIVVDTINTPFMDQAYGRQQLLKYLADRVEPGQVLALVTLGSKGMRVIHDLTSDPAVLVRALKRVNGELPAMQGVDIDTQAATVTGSPITDPSLPVTSAGLGGDVAAQLQDFLLHGDATIGSMQQQRAIEATMRGFLSIAWSLSGIPGRKSLIWLTGGFPFYMDSPAAVPGGYLSTLYEQAMQALNDAEISIYPVDARGLVGFSDASSSIRGGGAAFARSLSARSWLQNSTLGTLKDFAEMTGGRAFYNTNDLATSFQRAATDSSSYYLLGYYLDTKNSKGGWRQLRVKVAKPGAQVRARSGFFVTAATVDPELSRKTDMQLAFASPFDSTGIPLTVSWGDATANGGKKKVGFMVHLAGTAVTVDQGQNNHFSLEFNAIAFKKETSAANIGQTIEGNFAPAAIEKLKTNGVNFKSAVELASGDYLVRIVVRDNLSGRLGSVSAPLTVD
jgi:VWFA-related protein